MTTNLNGFAIVGAIEAKWLATGAQGGVLGLPTSNEQLTFDQTGRFQTFERGRVSWHPTIGAFAVVGLVCARWISIGAEEFGYPITDESICPDNHGRFNHFRTLQVAGHPEASIYWTPETGPVEVIGAIRQHWAKLGWETGPLKYPIAPEGPTFDSVGRNQPFQMGAMSWHPQSGAFSVIGSICARWRALGAEGFGYPITDESSCADHRGRYNHFRQLQDPRHPEASIYWTPETPAVEVYGGIRDRWARRGWEASTMRYPLEPEKDWPEGNGRQQRFQGGRIVWAPTMGALFDPLVFEGQITSGGLAALGGSWKISIAYNGGVRWEGHAKDSGADGYDYSVTAAIATPGGMTVAFLHSGHVGGTFTAGSDRDPWNEVHPSPGGVTLLELNDGIGSGHVEYTSDIGSTLESVVQWIVTFAVGTALSSVSGIVFVGVEVGTLIGSGSLGPGARVLGGTLWMAGPLNTLLALGADLIASQGYETTPLSYEEYDWANMQVYNGSLPPREDIVISNMLGVDGSAFTFPRIDGKTVISLGPTGFNDPRNYRGEMGSNWGRTFIHELVHACQIAYSPNNIAFVARALAANSRGHSKDVYNYPGPTVDYGSLNIEQQAQIVEDWYAGGASIHGPGQTSISRDPASPYYHFITNHVWQKAY